MGTRADGGSGPGGGVTWATLSAMTHPLRSTLKELTEAIHAKRLSPTELMEITLDRIDETHDRLNAIVSRRSREELMAEARLAERRVARGLARPLEGVPLGVKDLEDAAGLVTSNGSLLFRDRVAAQDSIQVERLKGAGAIVVGKTNTPEFGHTAITKNLLFGATRSPWDPARTPGGSSGGSAAALAGEVLPLVTASDGGGSIRIPASFTGAFGLKPSFGRVPNGPSALWSHGMTTVLGPLTKTVEDAAIVLDQVAGHDSRDPSSLPRPALSYLSALEEPLPPGLRVGFSLDLGRAVVQSDVAAIVEDAARTFERIGCTLVAVTGGPPDLGADWSMLVAWETAARLGSLVEERATDLSRSLLQELRSAKAITPAWWGEMARRRSEMVAWSAQRFKECDLLVTPTVPYDPPPAKGPFPSETEGRTQPVASVASFTIPFNMSWYPAASVRAGMSRSGLPVGMQIIGPLQREDMVLRAARAFERERPWHPYWPMRVEATAG
jgi:aspartyl-tRNA(Asn)/glutamyl-tRNA(Gln) amidotransferase subunit A